MSEGRDSGREEWEPFTSLSASACLTVSDAEAPRQKETIGHVGRVVDVLTPAVGAV